MATNTWGRNYVSPLSSESYTSALNSVSHMGNHLGDLNSLQWPDAISEIEAW